MPPQQVSEPSQSVGRALDGAGQLENGERRRHVEAAGKHPRGDIAFPRIRGVLGIYQTDDGGERLFGIGAASLRDFEGGGEPRRRGFSRGGGDRAQLGERRQQRRIDPGRRQRGDKSGLFQFIDGFLDAVHQLLDDRAGVETGHFLAGFEGNAICLAFDLAGAGRELLAVGRAACLQLGNMVGDRSGDIVRQSDLTQDDRKQRAVDAFQPPDQVCFDLVADQPDRSPRTQRFGRNAHRGLEEIDRGVAPERLIQPLAEADPGRRCVAHRGADQFIAAEFKEGAVTHPLPGGPIENARRIVFCDPAAQKLARLVPVDQKYQRSAEGRQEGVTLSGAVGLILAGDEKEGVVLAETRRDMAIEPAPFRLKLVEQGDEEFRARPVHVRIGHRHGILLDRDDHYVRVGGPDIVLNQQPAARPGRRGLEAGMVELQGAGLVEPLHETFHRRPVFGVQTEDMGARQNLLGAIHGQPVERLVQIHHQPMQAVGAVLFDAGQLGDTCNLDFIRGLKRTGGADRGEPRIHGFALGRFAGGYRAQHRRRVVLDFLHQPGEIGRGHPAVAGKMGAADQGRERGRRDAGGAAFHVQIGRRVIRLLRMMGGGLQRAHANLDPVVRGQPFRHQRRQQNVGLSELLDNLRFHDISAGDHP